MGDKIHVKKIKNFDTLIPKKSAFTIDTSSYPNVGKMHTLLVASGKRGGGKSVAVTTYVEKLMSLGFVDRVILISPTYHSNKTIFEPLHIDEENDILEPDKHAVPRVIKMVEEDKKEYETYLEELKQWKLFKRLMKNNTDIHSIDPELMMEFAQYKFFDNDGEKPKWKYGNGDHPPRIFVIIDDCMGSPLMNPRSGLLNLCIKHRHIAEGLGVSIAMLVQSYCAVGGLPRPIRENCTMLLLFKCKDENQIKKICEEVGTDIEVEDFLKLFKYATEKPYGFLCIDFSPKQPEHTFRSGWQEYLSI